MNYKHAPLFALVLLAGCAQDWRPDATARSPQGSNATPAAIASPVGVLAGAQRGGESFANAPDRGDLVAYPSQRVVRHDGAYTWHRTDLSEAHAIAAVADGRLTVTAPSGEKLDFRYERHVEHPSGDWTWIGRLVNGAKSDEVVLTFGAKAAFGTIAQAGGKPPLKLTIRDGVSWLVETDRARIADIRNRATRPHADDYLISPKLAGAPSQAGSVPQAASAPTAMAATAASGQTVDLVLGYTSGFAAALGGQSQAVTRLNNLVEITNQAYANSQVEGRVRLVHTLQVNYPDNTSNSEMLEKLTGFKAPSTRTTPDPAFSALRAAREQYGADLVSVVRKFNDPENDGCGIAWLIGGGESGFHSSDEYFGYSVVSEGRDQGTDGKTYFCREETLAHELGHNMGSQHDRTTATKDGVLKYGVSPYSFGYKTDSANGNFYTVMAYGDSGQTSYRTFSNPRTTFCGGRPCGIAEQADVARSLGQTMPVIAAFRATVVATPPSRRVPSDINGDGRSDILWYYGSQVAFWAMNGGTVQASVYAGDASPGYTLMTTGDFNGDGVGDFVFSNGSTLRFLLNGGSGTAFTVSQQQAGGAWLPFSASDMNGDGRSDLVWRYGSQVSYWTMNGSSIQSSVYAGDASPGFKAMCVADFNGDGAGDFVFSNGSELRIWINNGSGTGFTSHSYAAGGSWIPFTAGDVNGDGKGDLIWRYGSQVAYWIMDGGRFVSSVYAGDATPGFRVVTLSDFSGDGAGDFVFSNGSTLKIWINNGNGTGFTQTSQAAGGAWQLFDPNIVQ